MRTALLVVLLLTTAFTHAQAQDFDDNDYHEYILYNVDTPKIDVLIVPPASPYYTRDLVNIEKSVQAWDDGINALGDPWLADGVDIRFYTLGYDVPPAEALADPEIIIFSAEYNPVLLFGIGLAAPVTWCHGIGPGGGAEAFDLALHQHEQSPWASAHAECTDGGYQCTVINTNFFWLPDQENEINMYDLNQHELGHCLGIGHVGDAADFSAKSFPEQDIMSYQHNPQQVHCVSSLNILALEAVYGDLLGHPELHQHADTYVHMAPSQYNHVDCLNPDTGWTNVMDGVPLLGHQDPQPGSTIGGGGGGGGGGAATQVHVASVAASATHYANTGHRLLTTVEVDDDQGAPVSGASVSIAVTTPEGNTLGATGTTDAAGIVSLTVQQKGGGHGTWQTCVNNVWGSGLSYSSASNAQTCHDLVVS